MRGKKTMKSEKRVPAADFDTLRDLLGKPALLKGERLEDYQALEASLVVTLKPTDAQEYLWVRDIIELQWELLRMRQMKARFLSATASEGLKIILLDRGVDHSKLHPTASQWAKNVPQVIENVRQLFEEWGLDESDILAKTYMKHIADLERIERMIISVEGRRNAAMREFEKHREIKKKFLHDVTDIDMDEA